MKIKTMTVKELEKALEEARAAEEAQRARQKFKCTCGKMHAIKDCDVIQTHWFRPSSGYEDSFWSESDLKIICPTTQIRNRVYFGLRPEVDWKLRADYDYSPRLQFSRRYKHLFRKVIEDFDEDRGNWVNNEYFDKNFTKFGLHIGPTKNSD